MVFLGIPNIESWRQIIFSLNVCSGRNCCLQYLVGETDISSMTELIKSPAALPLLGFRNFKGWGWRGVGIMGMQCGEGRGWK